MELDSFWDLIERSARHNASPDTRLAWLAGQLATLSPGEIAQFRIHVDHLHRRADTWSLWGAADLICGGSCSDDLFWYFQLWLVGLGRTTFERAVADPDTLADVALVRGLARRSTADWDDDEWPDWEGLDYLAADVYAHVTGDEHGLDDALDAAGHDSPAMPAPRDQEWDFDDLGEMARRLPNLTRLFHPDWINPR